MTLELSGAAPGSFALLFFDGSFVSPFGPGQCALQLQAPKQLALLATSAAGEASRTLDVGTQPALVGVPISFQALAIELGGPFLGLGTLSAVLEAVVGG